MGPSPTIPTSFVPKQPVRSAARFEKTGGNIFLAVAFFMFFLAVAGAAGVFAYGKYLDGVTVRKEAELAATEASVNAGAVEEFIRFRDRFAAAEGLLDSHVAVSGFFDLLERLTLANVRFGSLAFERADDGTAEIELAGTARNFNALAVQSKSFAEEKLVKRAIFAGIATNENGTVGFTVSAELDPRLLVFAPTALPVSSTPAAVPAATTTAPASPVTPSATSSPVSL